jgi:hypothetical protein
VNRRAYNLLRRCALATFSLVSLDEARRAVLPTRQATQEAYRDYVRQLGPERAGRLELEETDRPMTERARLKAAAKAEGINLHIQRQGRTIVFWVSDQPPQPKRQAAGRARKRT